MIFRLIKKLIMKYCKIIRNILIVLIIPIFIVNLIPVNHSKIGFYYFFSFTIYDKGFIIYTSLITIASFIFFYWQWQGAELDQRIAHINGLYEELSHNLRLTDEFLEIIEQKDFYSKLNKEISKMKTELKYPSPCDLSKSKHDDLEKLVKRKCKSNSRGYYFKLRNEFITSAISSKIYFSLKTDQRIFINIGHLNYSIMRFNSCIDRFNNKKMKFKELQNEYFEWVHFRLYFLLIDLISYAGENIIDKQSVKEIKGL